MKYIYTLLLLGCISGLSWAQNNSILDFGLYKQDLKLLNPAAASIEDAQIFSLNYRAAALEYDDHPIDMYVSYENFVGALNSGLGIMIYHKSIGFVVENQISLMYNYQMRLNESSILSIGTQLNRNKHGMRYLYVDGGDPIIEAFEKSVFYEHDFGVYYENSKNGAGISVCNIFENRNTWMESIGTYRKRTLKAFVTNKLEINNNLKLNSLLAYQTEFDYYWRLNFDHTFEIKNILLGMNLTMFPEDNIRLSFDGGYNLNDFLQLVVHHAPVRKSYNFSSTEAMLRVRIKN